MILLVDSEGSDQTAQMLLTFAVRISRVESKTSVSQIVVFPQT